MTLVTGILLSNLVSEMQRDMEMWSPGANRFTYLWGQLAQTLSADSRSEWRIEDQD